MLTEESMWRTEIIAGHEEERKINILWISSNFDYKLTTLCKSLLNNGTEFRFGVVAGFTCFFKSMSRFLLHNSEWTQLIIFLPQLS